MPSPGASSRRTSSRARKRRSPPCRGARNGFVTAPSYNRGTVDRIVSRPKERAMAKSLIPWKPFAVATLLALAGCGGGGGGGGGTMPPPPPVATYSIGGTVFSSGGTIVLQDNGGDDLTLGNVGTFTFATKLA